MTRALQSAARRLAALRDSLAAAIREATRPAPVDLTRVHWG